MPDLNKAIKGRRKNLNRIWSSKEWKAQKAAFLLKNPNCKMHEDIGQIVPATIPHHPYRDSYKGHYTDLELSCCVAYCNRCHFALHKGLKLCKCGEHYHRWDQEMCRFCFEKEHPEVVIARDKYVEDQKAFKKSLKKKTAKPAAFLSFPCRFRLKEQHCEKGGICGYGKENYQKCRQHQDRPRRK